MLRPKVWFLIGLVSASCVVPDVEVVDSPSDEDDTPSTASGGKSSSPGSGAGPASGSPAEDGGSPGEPGTSGSTGRAGSAASGGSGPTPPAAAAFGKFCNDITVGGEPVTLTLSIGTGSKRVLLSAASGRCTPISGEACASVPVGTAIPVSLLDGNEPIVTYPVDFEDGAFWIFGAYTDGVNVDIAGDAVTQDVCEIGYDAPTPAQGT